MKSTSVPSDYDELITLKSFLDSIVRGIADAENAKVSRTEEVRAKLTARRNHEVSGV